MSELHAQGAFVAAVVKPMNVCPVPEDRPPEKYSRDRVFLKPSIHAKQAKKITRSAVRPEHMRP
ncbi:MAG: hypothetical protein HY912_02300 [Desulfomonile tiedjei]|uniref:Uncharacterized protein n=1 Tax=Desulfomonile tiedjei TaxID=2358 RepID=A0A9D6UXM4_9BACT|nr:hypothetical protein [Desulfomonile tiedjei]